MQINKTFKGKNTKVLIVVLIVFALSLIVVTVSSRQIALPTQTPKVSDTVEISDPQSGRKLTIKKDGFAQFNSTDADVSYIWERSKVDSLFEYISANFVEGLADGFSIIWGGKSGGIPFDDELINIIIDEGGSGGSGGGSDGGSDPGSGGSIADYFNTPAPSYHPFVPDTPPPGTPPPPPPSWCIHWKLSYCADVYYPPPSPTPPSSYPPGVIEATDCTEWTTQSQYKTVITNSSCYQLEE